MPNSSRPPAALRLARISQGAADPLHVAHPGQNPVAASAIGQAPASPAGQPIPEDLPPRGSEGRGSAWSDSDSDAVLTRLQRAPRLLAWRPWIAVAVVVGLALALVVVSTLRGRPQPVIAPGASTPGADVQAEGSVAAVTVHVTGSVAQPGLFTLPVGARVAEAVAAAGGPVAGTTLDTINLARRLNDGEQLVVGLPAVEAPASGQNDGSVEAAGQAAASSSLINLNQADSAQLQQLPRIGPATAEKIIEFRAREGPFTAVGQLLEVPGIGEATLAGLQDLVTV